jgi:proline dehydrogenase
MLRSLLIHLSKSARIHRLLSGWSFSRRVASRFVAGETIEDALRVVRVLNEKGIYASLDQLGEHTTNAAEANRSADGILVVLDEIQKANVAANISIKLTQIGMGLDDDTDDKTCRANLERILERAREYGNFVRIDMEDSPYTDRTLALYGGMLALGFSVETVGLVVQAYLYRTEKDVRHLLEKSTHFRLVKGAYQEPRELAFPQKPDVDANYDKLAALLIEATLAYPSKAGRNGRIPALAAIATHDEKRIAFARNYAAQIGLPKDVLEFQMLYGIRRDLQEGLARQGYPLRVYVPFGTHWVPYFMRRLAERPANLWFFVSSFFKE